MQRVSDQNARLTYMSHVQMTMLTTAWELLVAFMFILLQDLHSPCTALP